MTIVTSFDAVHTNSISVCCVTGSTTEKVKFEEIKNFYKFPLKKVSFLIKTAVTVNQQYFVNFAF